jgi:hypothetical protein
MSITKLLKKSAPGATTTIVGHIKRGEKIADRIKAKFDISHPQNWQATHLAEVLKDLDQEFSKTTADDYRRTARLISSALGKWPDWECYIFNKTKSLKNEGGRPPLLCNTNRKNSKWR